jgi:hypothetical protein
MLYIAILQNILIVYSINPLISLHFRSASNQKHTKIFSLESFIQKGFFGYFFNEVYIEHCGYNVLINFIIIYKITYMKLIFYNKIGYVKYFQNNFII